MKLSSREFEQIMRALDNDPDVNKRDRRDILRYMESCSGWDELDAYLEKIERRIERRQKREAKNAKTSKR